MLYTVLISLHASAGLVAFVAGLVALRGERHLGTYRWSLTAMAAFLVLAVASTPADRDAGGWAVSGAFVALAAVMLALAWSVHPGERRTPAGVHRTGFGVVGLFDAFWVVTLLRAGLPVGVVVAVGVGVALAGHVLLVRAAARLGPVTVT